MSAHAVLEEIGADYALRWIQLFADAPDPDFLAASPHCRTPAMAGPDGTVFETGAVCLYLAERHPDTGLNVPYGDPHRGTFLQWLHYLATTLQPEVIIQFHPEFHHQDAENQALLKASSMQRLRRVYDTLEDALPQDGPYFFGGTPTVLDFILAMQTIWGIIFPNGDIAAYPKLARHLDAVCARQATQRMLAQHRAEAKRRKECAA